MKRTYLWLGPVFVCGLMGCAVTPAVEAEDGDLGEVAQRIATATDIDHACDHARNPPGGAYVNLTAVASGTPPLAEEHEAYNISLPASGSSYSGKVRFIPDGDAEHGIYTDPTVTVSVKKGTQTVSLAWETDLDATTCPGSGNPNLPTYGTTASLTKVRTYDLTAGETYTITFTSSSSTILGLFENLDEH